MSRPRATTIEKVERVDKLTRSGWGLLDACAEVGLDPQTWYRRGPRIHVDQGQALVDVLQALLRRVA